jgi:hypothetical protein
VASDDLRFEEKASDSSALPPSTYQSSLVAEHEADAELRWFEQEYGREAGPSSRLTSTREVDEKKA